MGPWLFGFVGIQAARVIAERNPGISREMLDKAASPFGVLSVLIIFIIGGAFFIAFWRKGSSAAPETS